MKRETLRAWLVPAALCLLLALPLSSAAVAGAPERIGSLASVGSPTDAPDQLATDHVRTMTTNSTHVFWTISVGGEFCPTDGEPALRRVPLGGGTVQTLHHSCSFNPYQMAADDTHVYFADWADDKVKRIPVAGGTITNVANGNRLILHRGIALDSTHVYWGDNTGIQRIAKSGGAAQVLAAGADSANLAVDSTHVYWTDWNMGAGRIRRVAKTGGAVQDVITGLDNPYGIALDSTYVYFTELGTGKAYRVNKNGTGLTSYVASDISPYMAETIAANSTHVFWTDTTGTHTGRVRRAPVGGGTIEDLALGLFGPRGVSLDSTHVYWGDYDGVWRLPIAATAAKVDLTITDMEVTQAIQCLDNTTGATACADNSVHLRADKITYARVYPAVDLADTVGVNARLHGTRGGTTLPGSPISPTDTTLFVGTSGAQREVTSSSFNFLLPMSWRNGTVVLQAEINPGTVIPETNTANNMSTSATINFATAQNLSVAYVPINYTFSGWTGANTASNATMTAAGPFLRSLFPFSNVTYTAWPAGAAYTQDAAANPSAVITELNTRYLASTSPPDQLFAWFPSGSWNNGRSDPIWLGGSGHVSGGDEMYANAVCAHEIGHNLGRRHPLCADSSSDWPYGGTNADSVIHEVGFDVLTLSTHAATKRDWMTGGNCGNSSTDMWISPWNWTQILNGVQDWMGQIQAAAPQQGPTAVVTGQIWENGGELNPLFVLQEHLEPLGIPGGNTYCLNFMTRDGALLQQQCFDLDWRDRNWTGQSEVGNFGMRLPYPPETAQVQLTHGMEVLDELRTGEGPPEVQVLTPNGGEMWDGIHRIEWEAGDPGGGPLTYNVQYSADYGMTWHSLGGALADTSMEVDASQIPGSDMSLVRVLASNGLLTGHDQSDEPFAVRPHAPDVKIHTPADGAGFEPGEQIVLIGSANDLEDGPLTGDQLMWWIQGQGDPLFGEETSVRIYEPGTYEVTLEAVDSSQMYGQDTITIFVGPTISVVPPYSTVPVTQTLEVELRINEVVNLYGVQVELAFDPDVLEVVDASAFDPGVQIEQGDFPVPEVEIRNQADNQEGTIEYAVSLQGDKPGVSGSGVLATITFRGKAEGLSRVTFTKVIFSDPQSVPMSARTEHGVINVHEARGAILGQVILERRTSNASAQVCADSTCVHTAEDGTYVLPDIAPPGSYQVTASKPGYLRSWRQVDVPEGDVTLPDVTLLGGDVDGNDEIDEFDGIAMGLGWNTTPMDAEWNPNADITDDSNINILDMVAVQFNIDQEAPGPWGMQAVQHGLARAERQMASTNLAARVVLSPSTATLNAIGETVDMDIRIEDVVSLYGGRVQLSFDPTVLQVKDADPRPSSPGAQITPGSFLDPMNQFVIINEADNTAGTIDYAVTQLNPAEARTGSGVLATIKFEAAGAGTSGVSFDDASLGDDTRPNPQEIPSTTEDGQVTVSGRPRLYLPVILVG